MLFRDVINRVLRTVSEDEVDSATTELSDSYHKLIATFVNQIKEEIEDSHNWRVLWTTLPVTVAGGETAGAITGANERARLVRVQDASYGQYVPLVFDVTDPAQPFRMTEMDLSLLYAQNAQTTQTVVQPGNFSIGVDSDDGVPTLNVYPAPTSDRSYSVVMVVPQAHLEDDDLDTNIKIPARPLIMNTVYYALAERGEELGVDNIYTEERARKALDDAISRDEAEQGSNDLVAT